MFDFHELTAHDIYIYIYIFILNTFFTSHVKNLEYMKVSLFEMLHFHDIIFF